MSLAPRAVPKGRSGPASRQAAAVRSNARGAKRGFPGPARHRVPSRTAARYGPRKIEAASRMRSGMSHANYGLPDAHALQFMTRMACTPRGPPFSRVPSKGAPGTRGRKGAATRDCYIPHALQVFAFALRFPWRCRRVKWEGVRGDADLGILTYGTPSRHSSDVKDGRLAISTTRRLGRYSLNLDAMYFAKLAPLKSSVLGAKLLRL